LIPDYNSPAELGKFLESRGLGMRKKYGQNFLINPDIRQRLLDTLEISGGDTVWEIGPGLGAMTAGLLERGAAVCAFEIDPGFIAILKEIFGANEKFSLIEGDALKTWPAMSAGENTCLFGNLPYNIAAVLLADFIEKKRLFRKMVVTVQLETAQRLTAKPGTSDYSSLTVLCSAFYKINPLMIIRGASFYPAPRVDSRGLRFDLLPEHKDPPDLFYTLTRSLFSSRRKTIQNNLLNFVSAVIMKKGSEKTAAELTEQVFRQSGICGGRRAETLETGEFILLALVLEELTGCGS